MTVVTLAAMAAVGVTILVVQLIGLYRVAQLVGLHSDDVVFLDLLVYRSGGRAVINGHSLYAADFATLNNSPKGLAFTYPPFAALMFVPLAILPLGVAKVLMVALNAAACAGLFVPILLAVKNRWGRIRSWQSVAAPTSVKTGVVVFASAVVFLLSVPVEGNFAFGQVDLLLAALVALDVLLPSVRWPRGLLVGLAVAIKLTPAVFLGYFLVTRQWRALAVSVATAASAVVVGWLVLPGDTIRYFTSALFDPARIGAPTFASNQSLRGVIERIPALDSVGGMLWVAAVVLVLAVGIIAIEVNRRSGETVAAMLSAAFIGLLCSPVSWGHHWVWLSAAAAYFLLRWLAVGGHRNLVAGVTVSVIVVAAPWMFLPNSDERERLWRPFEHMLGAVWSVTAFALLIGLATAWTAPRPAKPLRAVSVR